MKVILDCNVLISAGISKNGTCGKVLDEVIRFHQLYFSHPTLQEFLSVIEYPRLERYRHKLKGIEKVFRKAALEVKPDLNPIDLPDPDDVVYLQTAVAAQGDSGGFMQQSHLVAKLMFSAGCPCAPEPSRYVY